MILFVPHAQRLAPLHLALHFILWQTWLRFLGLPGHLAGRKNCTIGAGTQLRGHSACALAPASRSHCWSASHVPQQVTSSSHGAPAVATQSVVGRHVEPQGCSCPSHASPTVGLRRSAHCHIRGTHGLVTHPHNGFSLQRSELVTLINAIRAEARGAHRHSAFALVSSSQQPPPLLQSSNRPLHSGGGS